MSDPPSHHDPAEDPIAQASCETLEAGLAGQLDDEAWRLHLESCASCRRHAELDRDLPRLIREGIRPRLSAEFHRRLMSEVASRRRPSRRSLLGGSRGLVAAYWLAASLLALLILARLPAETSPLALLVLIATFAPVGLLSRSLGYDLLDVF